MKSAEGYRVELSTAAQAATEETTRSAHERVIRCFEKLRDNPFLRGCVKISGMENLFRVRVGDCRVVYLVLEAERAIVIARVAHRKDVYRKSPRPPR